MTTFAFSVFAAIIVLLFAPGTDGAVFGGYGPPYGGGGFPGESFYRPYFGRPNGFTHSRNFLCLGKMPAPLWARCRGIPVSGCRDMPLLNRAAVLLRQAALTEADVVNVTTAAENWDVDGVRTAIIDLVRAKFNGTERNETMQLLDELAPPMSFTDALEAFTVEQRAHVTELVRSERFRDIAVIVNGVIASLPDEDQPQARRFVHAVYFLLRHPFWLNRW